VAKHRKSKVEKLHSTGTVAQELAKTANKFHKLMVAPEHKVKWGKGE